jgi:hypothetical protein
MPLLLLLGLKNTVICHCGEFRVAIGVAKESECKITSNFTENEKWSFSVSTFLQDSSTKATQLPILFCLKEPYKIKNDVWIYGLRK